ncbi:MAG: SDR family oxidoreductase [Alphaproteobacteria bacterium]|nr:SDR family oxidoreductase [Alphaproteobacteria bacterium]
MSKSLEGKTALVTGASSGIGRAIARKLSKMGCKLVLAARERKTLELVADELEGESICVPTDLADRAQVDALVKEAVKKFGSLDILIENAGIYTSDTFSDMTPEAMQKMIDVNLTSIMVLSHAVLPYMKQQQSGEIMVIGSIAGVADMRDEAVYSATKHAANAFVRSLRRQVASDGIRVGSILPGTVATELWGDIDPARIDQQVAEGEVLRPEDIAEIAAFMLQQPANVTIRELVVLPQAQDI